MVSSTLLVQVESFWLSSKVKKALPSPVDRLKARKRYESSPGSRQALHTLRMSVLSPGPPVLNSHSSGSSSFELGSNTTSGLPVPSAAVTRSQSVGRHDQSIVAWQA